MPKRLPAALLAVCVAAPVDAGGIPVIDVAAISQLIQQIAYWQQQLAAMGQQLDQLHRTHNAMTGTRGMQDVLPMSEDERNYLPRDYAELVNTVRGISYSYAGLTGRMQAAMAANAVLSNAQLRTLTPEMRQLVENGRRSSAMLASATQVAYQQTSERFAALHEFINRIATAGDVKAIQDLQGRIHVEQVLLTNEQTKLQTLYHMAQADQLVQQQRVREQVIAGHGGFRARFTPSPSKGQTP